jgi:predicted transcriptional regulator
MSNAGIGEVTGPYRSCEDLKLSEMANRMTRDRMVQAIRELPADATVDNAIERLVFLAKIEEGFAQLDRGEGVPHDGVK